ncbi:MAG: aminoacyl-tRNA hydrolase [Bacteroidetes bacterium]|nr:aminoacyl-tRNA hydrolase [Bacteroidota bacterium]
MNIKERDFTKEIEIKASRSSGKGGQNVNKVSTKIELVFDVNNSELLTDEEKFVINQKLANRISKEGKLILQSQESRSQLMNKEIAIEKLYELLEGALKKEKPRKATKPSKAKKEQRLQVKKVISEKKKSRNFKKFNDD